MRNQLAEQRSRLAELTATYRPDHPEVKQLQAKVIDLEAAQARGLWARR